MARNLYLPKNMPQFTMDDENLIYQRFFKGYNAFKDKDDLKNLIEGITIYRKELKTFNITDADVGELKLTFWKQGWNMFHSLYRLFFSIIFALPGQLMVFPLQ